MQGSQKPPPGYRLTWRNTPQEGGRVGRRLGVSLDLRLKVGSAAVVTVGTVKARHEADREVGYYFYCASQPHLGIAHINTSTRLHPPTPEGLVAARRALWAYIIECLSQI